MKAGPDLPARPRRRALGAVTAAFMLLGAAGCSTGREAGEAATTPTAAATMPFNADASAARLEAGRAAEQAGDVAEAARLYREAGLLWPDNAEAWTALAAAAAAAGDAPEAEAARFMAQRVGLYDSGRLETQRLAAQALDLFVAERRRQPEANPALLSYAETLSAYYAFRHGARGAYESPAGLADIAPREWPAVIATGGVSAIYLGTLLQGQ